MKRTVFCDLASLALVATEDGPGGLLRKVAIYLPRDTTSQPSKHNLKIHNVLVHIFQQPTYARYIKRVTLAFAFSQSIR